MTTAVVPIRRPRSEGPVLSDEAVATAAATGDASAITELFDRLHQQVARFLSRVVGPGPEVEDLVQATFLEVARGKARFEGRSTARVWLLGIAANVGRHHLRSLARRKRLERAIAVVPALDGPGLAATIDARREIERAKEALEALPASKRLAFVLCEVEGLSARDAAHALHTSEAAVWKRVSLARKALRRAVSEEES